MKYKSAFKSWINGEKFKVAKMIIIGFVLILAFICFSSNTTRVEAIDEENITVDILGTMYDKDGEDGLEDDEKDFSKVNLQTTDNKILTFIQGNGNNDEVAIKLKITNFPQDAVAFMIVERERSDSAGTNADSDRYTKELVTDGEGNTSLQWVASDKNLTPSGGIAGSVQFSEDANGIITANVIYRIRQGKYGMSFLTIFFYKEYTDEGAGGGGAAEGGGEVEEGEGEGEGEEVALLAAAPTPSMFGSKTVFYVISRPIDSVAQSASNCTGINTEEICVQYAVSDPSSRIAKELKIYIPKTIAFDFKNDVEIETYDYTYATGSNKVVNNFNDIKNGNTIYAISYFTESEGGAVEVAEKTNANAKTYLYTNFEIDSTGMDATGVTEWFYNDTNDGNYTYFLNSFNSNEIGYIKTKVDSVGKYIYYMQDIFGNKKEIVQDVTNVKNRGIITEMKKSNATDTGFDAVETYQNESVKVSITMTTETHFEVGTCLDEKCSKIINLTSETVEQIKYWRVDVKETDTDAYVAGSGNQNYGLEANAAADSTYNLFCKTTSVCTSPQTISDSADLTLESSAGFLTFNSNIIEMYIGVNGRYRYYIKDIYGNDTLGVSGNLVEEEYRNPRVEVYGIDKKAPEITFGEVTNSLSSFSIDSYEYYKGIELVKNESGEFLYNAKVTDTDDAVERTISEKIYYPVDRLAGRNDDKDFTDALAINLSKVIVGEYVYYYNNSKVLFSEYTGIDDTYDSKGYDNDISTILVNVKNNSNGLKLDNSAFVFKEINYYHSDGTTPVCNMIKDLGDAYSGYTSEMDCVNYYLDHAVDFVIEFVAEDSVGNIGKNKISVDVVDTTPPGFTYVEDKLIRASNIGTDCRMEIGQEIGVGKNQNAATMLKCLNIDLGTAIYNFEDNVFDYDTHNGLFFVNEVGNVSHVKLSIKGDSGSWVDLSANTFIPNKTGYYDLQIIINDEADNKLTIESSYYVDKRIVLVRPLAEEKFYGDNDPVNNGNDIGFNYCVYVDIGNNYDIRFSENPYSDLTIFTEVYCTNDDRVATGKTKVFQQNTGSDFSGVLTRQESSWYNKNLTTPILLGATEVGVENNYVGLYKIILGTLNVYKDGNTDPDYIVKIHPDESYRDQTNARHDGGSNAITDANMFEDDHPYTESLIKFKIKQVVIKVTAEGGEKNYGEKDDGYSDYNVDSADNYLGGVKKVDGLKSDDNQYTDGEDVVLGVLRREIGENVGLYKICNYRGDEKEDTALETINNMYLNCVDINTPEVDLNDASTHEYDERGILKVNSNYIKSRALYVRTNKIGVAGKTLNVTNKSRDNNYANYVINYVGADYIINSIDLVVQGAPGQRREYNRTNPLEPDPWEIILYGLVDDNIRRIPQIEDVISTFNGYTADADSYEVVTANDSREVAQIEANKSETRDEWKLKHEGNELIGLKTNQTYSLLRNTAASSAAGSAKLLRENASIITGGWYLYESLANDLNIVSTASANTLSQIAVITNGREQCNYDSTGHNITGVDGETLCKNYNLVYNPYYTNSEGYTIETKDDDLHEPTTVTINGDSVDIYEDFVYNSNGESCIGDDSYDTCYTSYGSGVEEKDKKYYKIMFEIYRREIVLEFNSALETVKDKNDNKWNIFYGKRYNYYKNSLFDYVTTEVSPEGYLFLCYQEKENMTPSNLNDNGGSGGCTNNPNYGLTQGDTWANIGLTFKMHDLVSNDSQSAFYSDSEKAIPAGIYYIYSDINEDQKRNYKYTYLGGTLTIKSLPVQVLITNYTREYGEKYYTHYGLDENYQSFTEFSEMCLLSDKELFTGDTLIGFDEGVYCVSDTADFVNEETNVYGFQIVGLDSMDTIKDNFNGRPNRARNGSVANDDYGLQENAGTHTITQGTIKSIVNNSYITNGNHCTVDQVGTDGLNCVVQTNKNLPNYAIQTEDRTYTFDLVGKANPVSSALTISIPETINGKLFITPALITITVTTNQTKMYGCAYNTVNTTNSYLYSYATGYETNCIETDGSYYDLGYKYTVSGDKDYQIAIADSFADVTYSPTNTYDVSGIKGSTTFRPSMETYTGAKAHALNQGTLYRIPWSEYFNGTAGATNGIKMSTYVSKAEGAQLSSNKVYQGQVVGDYVLTLGNVDATDNTGGGTYYNNACTATGLPQLGADFICKNYTINYYNSSVYEIDPTDETSVASESAQKYTTASGEFPSELKFTITKRKAYVYTDYDQKIYGELDMYSNPPANQAIYKCGDYNMDGVIDVNDLITLEGGETINGDIYNGFCTQVDVTEAKEINYGLTRYYTKYNSLAKAPWNGKGDRNDFQTDVLEGKISREGESGAAPQTDDTRAYYKYVYENNVYGGTVHLTDSYGVDNYEVNYYNNNTEKLAVKADGTTTTTYNGVAKDVKYEIVFRQIKVAFVSFDKVYGENDNVGDYNILVCAPSEEFDFVNMKCTGKAANDEHGLSVAHSEEYLDGGILNQSTFKNDFIVRFIRVLGENVSCKTTSGKIENSLSGFFYGGSEVTNDGKTYTYTLSCKTAQLKKPDNTTYDKTVYETLAYIDQNSGNLGYNYQINYTIGYVNITPRPINITPDANQGFEYGNYHKVLIPAITYKDSVGTGANIDAEYGLVHGSGEQGICLYNINYYNNDLDDRSNLANGSCFIANDRIDEYDPMTNQSTSAYDSSAVDQSEGLDNLDVKNFVFGDAYTTESDDTRSALNRTLSNSNSRYNRNVGVYDIVLGDLADKSGNYDITFISGAKYTITSTNIKLTPDSTSLETTIVGTTQTGQYKIYGEQDKELTFTSLTTYTVASKHYARYNSNIVSVKSGDDTNLLADIQRYSIVNGEYTEADPGVYANTYIILNKGDVVTINGFAYDENNSQVDEHYNYGLSQIGKKNGSEDASVNQGLPAGSSVTIYHFDKVCNNTEENVGCNVVDNIPSLSYGTTSRILLGYLYVENYSQAAGVYKILNGLYVANNEWGNKNYILSVNETIDYTIIPRPIGIQIANINKVYGQATDILSCDASVGNCSMESNQILITDNEYLIYNFHVSSFSGATGNGTSPNIEGILDGYEIGTDTYNNSSLYSQNETYASGLAQNASYTQSGTIDTKLTEALGVYVSRDERNKNNDACMYAGDKYGFCEDAGEYSLRLYGYANTIDNISLNNYQTIYRPKTVAYDDLNSDVEKYYYNSYFGYNPNYFVIVIDSSNIAVENIFETDATKVASTSRLATAGAKAYNKMLKETAKLSISKKEVALVVNTTYFEEGREVYYVGQNTNPPSLPVIDETTNVKYNEFTGSNGVTKNRNDALNGSGSYGKVVWGLHPTQVRKGDKLAGALSYCNKIISHDAYIEMWDNGMSSNYCDDSLLINEANKNNVDTNLEGYVPIVRSLDTLSIVNVSTSAPNKNYEAKNYSVKFYPGALRIEEDDVKPVVEVNREHVYIEANGIGTYLYECVGKQGTTTYTNCKEGGYADGISVVGKTELVTEGDPILNWLNTASIADYSYIVKADLPKLAGCDTDVNCRPSAYFEKTYGKLKTGYTAIKNNEENSTVAPFTMKKSGYVKNEGPSNLKELIITMADWFGVTAYDEGEYRNGQYLDKHFDKYLYMIIEQAGTNGDFLINRVGDYKVHFYVMDNAGNVSEGNMYKDVEGVKTLETTYSNVGTLHIIDTTKPVVGTLNLYSGKVKCIADSGNNNDVIDCTAEENWKVAQDTYVHISTLLQYNSDRTPYSADQGVVWVDVGGSSLVKLSSLTRYSKQANAETYTEDVLGRYIKIEAGANARALKHYGWSNSPSGIYLTITGGSDNSYTETNLSAAMEDKSQWQHYYSRDGGITWHLYDRDQNGRTNDGNATYLALNAEGSREILIKAVDSGVKIESQQEKSKEYIDRIYDNNNTIKETIMYFEFTNSTNTSNGWNLSDAASNDETKANEISLLISGKNASANNDYKFYRDRQKAYLDRTSPIAALEGEKLYVHEFGCATLCNVGYEEEFANAIDNASGTSKEIPSTSFDLVYSEFINHNMFVRGVDANYNGNYDENTEETLSAVITASSGLGSDGYLMNGNTAVGTDIRNISLLNRSYIIYSFDSDDTKVVSDLSDKIPVSNTSTTGEENIYAIIGDPTTYNEDFTYTIIYIIADKAGNESAYISRGVIYINLVPNLSVDNAGEGENEEDAVTPESVVQVSENSYSLTVEQGSDIEQVLNSFKVNAQNKKDFLTQTVYHNGELVVDDKKYQKDIYDGFTTSVPGTYEITYNLRYMYYDDEGNSELIEATPIKFTIVIEATPPLVESTKTINYSYLFVAVSVLIASLALCYFGLLSRKRK